MKLEFPYKCGDFITIYEDWETESRILGTARLRSFHSQGRSFILEDTLPESNQIVYNYQEWLVDWDMVNYKIAKERIFIFEKPVKIRYIDTIGLANSADDLHD